MQRHVLPKEWSKYLHILVAIIINKSEIQSKSPIVSQILGTRIF